MNDENRFQWIDRELNLVPNLKQSKVLHPYLVAHALSHNPWMTSPT